jgi:hypothetical protein
MHVVRSSTYNKQLEWHTCSPCAHAHVVGVLVVHSTRMRTRASGERSEARRQWSPPAATQQSIRMSVLPGCWARSQEGCVCKTPRDQRPLRVGCLSQQPCLSIQQHGHGAMPCLWSALGSMYYVVSTLSRAREY